MFKVFLLSLGIFLCVILGLALGYIFKRRPLQGSCGGISSLGIKKVCNCDEPCDELRAKIQQGIANTDEIARFNKF